MGIFRYRGRLELRVTELRVTSYEFEDLEALPQRIREVLEVKN